MEEEAIFRETSDILEELDEIRNDIKSYKRKHEESVEKSLSVLDDIESNLLRRGFRLYLSYLTEDAKTEENLNLIHSLATMVKKNIETLKLFVLSEIVHRKILELQFKLTHPFFFKELKRTLGNIELDLEELDEKASSEEKRGDIRERKKDYGDIIKRTKSLEKTVWEEKKSGLLGYLKFLFVSSIAGFGWLFYIFGYLQIDLRFYHILGAILLFLIFFPVLLLIWNYYSYGVRLILQRRGITITLILGYVALIIVPYVVFANRLSIFNFLTAFFIIFFYTFVLAIVFSYEVYRRRLSEKTINDIFRKFFPQGKIFSLQGGNYRYLRRNISRVRKLKDNDQ